MYSKLVVSSLESRALNGDRRAIAELVSRSKQGMKRARLAIERLLILKLPTETRDQLLGYKYSPETIQTVRETIHPTNNAQDISYPIKRKVIPSYSTGEQIKTKCGHKGYWDLNCPTCRADYESGFEPLIAEELEEIKTDGYRTAQQMDNEKRGMK